MSRAQDAARWLRFAIAEGPIPSAAGRTAWATNGWPANDERLLTASLRRAGIKPKRDGHTGTWWWRAPSDETPIGAETRAHECTACRKLLELPSEHRYCISTPRCPGQYQPALWATRQQATHESHRALNEPDLSQWRSRPSPLRIRRSQPPRRSSRPAPRWPEQESSNT